ncbi:MAG: Gfo/Idh/MocA family oxidoreductase [Candidatus Hydrogenedentes bacterium]|nr:Gfo/Idh/MocA family oxidoreductase [Candidatus Hydrogenedentota bacterium]
MGNEYDTGMSRRDFAKVSAAAAGFAILTGTTQAAKAASNGDTLKVGLLGCGNRGTGAAINMLEGKNNVKLVAMADLFEDRLKSSRDKIANSNNPEVKNRYDVKDDSCFIGFDAYQKLLKTDVDIVIEGTLPYSRPKHIEAIVNANKHLFSEKPVAVQPEGIRQVIAAAEKAKELKLSFVAGTQRRHQQEYVETIKRIHDGEIGDVLALRAYWCGGLPFAYDRKPEWSDLEYRIRNWYGQCWVAGDNIVEQHVHNLDVCNWVMNGHPIRVFASGGRTWKPKEEKYGDIYDHFDCDFEYENGVHMTSFSRHWQKCGDGVFEDAVGTKGRSNCTSIGDWKAPGGLNPYVQEHIDLVKSITGEGPYLNEGVQVAESTMTAIMGRMAAYTGQVQVWGKALKTDLNLVPEELDFAKAYPLSPVPAPGSGA